MGKLLSGRYGSKPEAESVPITLVECNRKLNLKPSDFVSEGPPKFFEKSFGSSAHYLLFLAEPDDIKESRIWKSGYYLLPLILEDMLSAIEKKRSPASTEERGVLPLKAKKGFRTLRT